MVLENMTCAQFQSGWAKETYVNFGLIRAKSSKVNNEVLWVTVCDYENQGLLYYIYILLLIF